MEHGSQSRVLELMNWSADELQKLQVKLLRQNEFTVSQDEQDVKVEQTKQLDKLQDSHAFVESLAYSPAGQESQNPVVKLKMQFAFTSQILQELMLRQSLQPTIKQEEHEPSVVLGKKSAA